MKLLLNLCASALFLVSATVAVQSQQENPQEKPARDEVERDPVLPAGEGRDLVSKTCSQCHLLGVVTRHREDGARWKRYVDDMIVRGTKLTPADAKTVVQYLTKNYAPAPPPPAAASPPATVDASMLAEGEGRDLVAAACSMCHDLERVRRVYRDEQGWTDLVANMVSRGAMITPEEAQKIRVYLFAHYGIHD